MYCWSTCVYFLFLVVLRLGSPAPAHAPPWPGFDSWARPDSWFIRREGQAWVFCEVSIRKGIYQTVKPVLNQICVQMICWDDTAKTKTWCKPERQNCSSLSRESVLTNKMWNHTFSTSTLLFLPIRFISIFLFFFFKRGKGNKAQRYTWSCCLSIQQRKFPSSATKIYKQQKVW